MNVLLKEDQWKLHFKNVNIYKIRKIKKEICMLYLCSVELALNVWAMKKNIRNNIVIQLWDWMREARWKLQIYTTYVTRSLNVRECRNVVLNPVKVVLNWPWFLKTLMTILVISRKFIEVFAFWDIARRRFVVCYRRFGTTLIFQHGCYTMKLIKMHFQLLYSHKVPRHRRPKDWTSPSCLQ